MNEWISINNRLPEEYYWVLVSAVDLENSKLRFVPHVAELRKGKWSVQVGDNRDLEKWLHIKVTHWMQLPDPPKE